MKKLLLPALLFSGWMALLHSDVPVEGNFLPALGRFLNPFGGIWQNVNPNLHSDFKGKTTGRVKILFDDRDIPHIYADNLEDAIYAQGYLHASNRLFAMDLSTRSAAGRLSELVGNKTVTIDRKQRERGFEWSAIQKAQNWESYPGNKKLMESYVRGVNSYIESLDYKDWPVEYKILSHPPVTWTSTHSALMLTNMAISLCIQEDDLEYSTARTKLSPEDYSFLFPDHNPKESPIIPPGKAWDFTPLSAATPTNGKVVPALHGNTEDSRQQDLNGSNNWAVAAGKTANGFPILANDPHLNLTLPNIWYEMEIHTPEMNVHGVSLPGLPLIIIGFNENIAWGSTNSGQDVLDWFQISWQDTSRLSYKLDGKYVSATLRPEEIKIRGEKSITDTIRYTHWGPVSHLDEHKDMAMKWIGHQKATTNDIDYLLKIDKASDLNAYRDAVAAFQYPAQNKVFASIEGDVAISVAGVIPLRPHGLGETLTSGAESSQDWQGYIPFEHAPYVVNPARGFVSSANQASADASYPYQLLGKRYFEDYRGRVVNMVLDTSKKLTPEDMKTLQQNNYNLYAAEILPYLLGALGSSGCMSETEKQIAGQLGKWNYMQHRDSLSPVLFDLWHQAFEDMTWEELDTLGVMRPEEWRMIEILRDHPHHRYFDVVQTQDRQETFQDIACASFSGMCKEFLGMKAEEKRNWGAYKHSTIPHLARFPQFGVEFINTSGGKHIVNAMSKSQGPSWRMIVELSSPPKAWVNYPGGQSGDPASPHYKDMLDGFFEGKYYEVALRNDPGAWTPVRQITIAPQ